MASKLPTQKVVVTGAAGFLGSHLAEHFCKTSDSQVLGVDNYLTGQRKNTQLLQETYDTYHFVEADAALPVSEYLPAEFAQPDLVCHFASPASPIWYQQYPVETYQVNAWGTHHWLEYLSQSSSGTRFLYAGTSEAYGDPLQHPQSEEYWGNVNSFGPRSCYDESKRMAESIGYVFYTQHQLDVRIVRIFNTYGPRMNPKDGRVIPNFVAQAQAGQPLSIYGDGSQTRSYCYVDDLIAGIVELATRPGLSGQIVNIGNPQEYTVRETAEIILRALGREISEDSFVYESLPKDDPTRRQPNISKAKRLLDWQPSVSLEEGIKLLATQSSSV